MHLHFSIEKHLMPVYFNTFIWRKTKKCEEKDYVEIITVSRF